MNIVAIIFFMVFLLSIIWIGVRLDKKDSEHPLCNAFALLGVPISLMILFVILFDSIDKSYPKAIDVYRGKTELNIVYKINNNNDTLSVDSTVIFKDFSNGE